MGARWTEEELNLIREVDGGAAVAPVAAELGRTIAAVHSKRFEQNMVRSQDPRVSAFARLYGVSRKVIRQTGVELIAATPAHMRRLRFGWKGTKPHP